MAKSRPHQHVHALTLTISGCFLQWSYVSVRPGGQFAQYGTAGLGMFLVHPGLLPSSKVPQHGGTLGVYVESCFMLQTIKYWKGEKVFYPFS